MKTVEAVVPGFVEGVTKRLVSVGVLLRFVSTHTISAFVPYRLRVVVAVVSGVAVG